MTIGNFIETIGSSENDSFISSEFVVVYGLGGDDQIDAEDETSLTNWMVGGTGNDAYTVESPLMGVTLNIITDAGGSENDTIFFDSLFVDSSPGVPVESGLQVLEFDNRHLLFLDTVESSIVIVPDWQEPENRIETFDFGLGFGERVLTFEDLQSIVSPVSSITWSDLLEPGLAINTIVSNLTGEPVRDFSDDEINSAFINSISAVSDRAFELEPNAITVELPPEEEPGTVYRFLNTDLGVHFYTASVDERDNVFTNLPQFEYEGASFASVDSLTGVETSPVYRFLNTDTGVHFYTISEVERSQVEENLPQYVFEGEAYEAFASEEPDSIPLYRFFNPTTGAHFYTPSETERDVVQANLPDYNFEGIGFYVDSL